nr:helix-turn-helix domain-containing protein [Nocardia miyunensis]
MASAQRGPVPAIARLLQVSEAYVRQVIHDFNEPGVRGTGPRMERGQVNPLTGPGARGRPASA